MKYTTYGMTGLRVSRLGFGAMRLPLLPGTDGDEEKVDFDKSTALIRRAFALGVNFIDTHHNYHDSQSEEAIGRATEGLDRSSFFIQTKSSTWKELDPGETYRGRLEAGLKRAKTGYFDVYFMHSLRWENFEKIGDRFMKEITEARGEGLVRHIGFSTHDSHENVVKLIDTGLFEAMLCQYNLLDLSNERAMDYARSKGLGVSVMGPVGGGRLATPSALTAVLPPEKFSAPEVALRFVLSNPSVDVAVSGMNAIEQVEENARTASVDAPLTAREKRRVRQVNEEKHKIADLYCTGCGYCMPCPNGVRIPRIFEFMNWIRVYGLAEGPAKEHYSWMKRRGADASKCVECGQCQPKCPQKIEIIRQLKECDKALS